MIEIIVCLVLLFFIAIIGIYTIKLEDVIVDLKVELDNIKTQQFIFNNAVKSSLFGLKDSVVHNIGLIDKVRFICKELGIKEHINAKDEQILIIEKKVVKKGIKTRK